MRKVVFNIDDIEYFKRIYKFTNEQAAEIFKDIESFKCIYTIIGQGNNPERYELRDLNGIEIQLNSLNAYQKGVVLNDCMEYFIGGKYDGKKNKPCGVIKIEETVMND